MFTVGAGIINVRLRSSIWPKDSCVSARPGPPAPQTAKPPPSASLKTVSPALTRSSGLLKSVLHCRRKSKPQEPVLLTHKAAFQGGATGNMSWLDHGQCRSDLMLQLALKMRPRPFSPKLTDLRARKPPSCLGVTGTILTSPILAESCERTGAVALCSLEVFVSQARH